MGAYLNFADIIRLAKEKGVEAIHPGYVWDLWVCPRVLSLVLLSRFSMNSTSADALLKGPNT